MIKHGVLTIESKSGYGLDKENELKQLRVSNQLADKYNLDIKHTFLGPHAVPEEAESNEAFLEEMIELLLKLENMLTLQIFSVKREYSQWKNLSVIWKKLKKLALKLKFMQMKLIH